jgi:hypothetical protein
VGNEIELVVTASDATKPTQDALKASYNEWAKSFQPIGLTATNPINDAFMAQVRASIKELSSQELLIPVEPDTEAFREQLQAQVQEIASVTKADIPLEPANADAFRAEVLEQVEAISAQARVVVEVDTDEASLAEARAAILSAADASQAEVQAQQDLNDALAKNNADDIAKAEEDLAAAQKTSADTAEAQAAAMDVAAEAEAAASVAAEAASTSFRGMGAAMGPVYLLINAVQMAMFAFGGSSSSVAAGVQDMSQQLIALGRDGSSAASSLSGNSGLAGINTQLDTIGSSSAAFSQAFSGSLQMAKGYVENLTSAQSALGAQSVVVGQEMVSGSSGGKAAGESLTETYKTTTQTIAQLTQQVNDHKIAESSLPQAVQDNITKYNAYNDVINQATKAYNDEQASLLVITQDLAQQGIVLSSAQQGWNSIGQAVAGTVSQYNTATAGVKEITDATVAAAAANISATTQFQQLDQAVTSSANSLAQAEHGIVSAQQGVASALQGIQSAQDGATQAEQAYQNALGQETVAQQAVAAARKAAQQNLIDLQLQANDAAAGTLNAGVGLFDATTSAAALGVNASNAHSIAAGQVTAGNEAQVKAAIALIEAQNQVADAQNSSAQAQSGLTSAQQLGIDGNAGVVSANQSLVNSSQQVVSAQHGVQTAQEAVNAASLALSNAQYAVQQAQQAARQASEAYTTAQQDASRNTDITTAAGNRNYTMLEGLYEKNYSATQSVQDATAATEAEGEKMGFTAGQIDGVISAVTRIPLVTNFSIVGTPSLNLATLLQQASAQGISPYSLGLPASQVDLAQGGTHYAQGGPIGGAGGPTADDQLIWASSGEHMWTADEVQAAGGHQAVAALRRSAKGYASGGPVTPQQAMGVNLRLAGWDAFLQSVSYGLQGMGAKTPNLPTGTQKVDLGSFGVPTVGITGGVSGSRAQNKAIMQQVFASMFGWTGQQWADAVTLEMMEAGFNNTAQNPTSTAYGMGQFLNSTWAGYGIPKTSDPTLQSEAMGRYISARYGSPAGALSHEDAYHWYGAGGPAGGVVGIGDGGPEAVRLPNGSTVMPAANTAALSQGADQITKIEVIFGGNTDGALATAFMKLVRGNEIQLNVNGQRVRVG